MAYGHAQILENASLDARIVYPSYKSMDEFIDVEWLRSLNGELTRKLQERLLKGQGTYFLNEHRRDKDSAYEPGVREVWLSKTLPGVPYNYLDLDRADLWTETEDAAEFEPLMEFIRSLPFEARGRQIIIFDGGNREVPAHRDHLSTDVCNEFIWMRTNLKKPLYMLNDETGEKLYVESYSAWFDSVNQYHGSDSTEGLTFSIRVDGIFSPELRRQIPRPASNAASTAAYWTSIEK
jgi:hypothetical protein